MEKSRFIIDFTGKCIGHDLKIYEGSNITTKSLNNFVI